MHFRFGQNAHNHGAAWRICSRVGGLMLTWRGMPPAWRESSAKESPRGCSWFLSGVRLPMASKKSPAYLSRRSLGPRTGAVIVPQVSAIADPIAAPAARSVACQALFGRLPSARGDGSSCRHPKTCSGPDSCSAANHVERIEKVHAGSALLPGWDQRAIARDASIEGWPCCHRVFSTPLSPATADRATSRM
jgi:hypothetical protein